MWAFNGLVGGAAGPDGETAQEAQVAPWQQEVLTGHLIKAEAALEQMQRQVDELVRTTQHQQIKVHELLVQTTLVAEAVVGEQHKGRERDRQIARLLDGDAVEEPRPAPVGPGAEPEASRGGGVASQLRALKAEVTEDLEGKLNALRDKLQADMQNTSQLLRASQAASRGNTEGLAALQQAVQTLENKNALQVISGSIFSLKSAQMSSAARGQSLKTLEEEEETLRQLLATPGSPGAEGGEGGDAQTRHSGADVSHFWTVEHGVKNQRPGTAARTGAPPPASPTPTASIARRNTMSRLASFLRPSTTARPRDSG